jgi:hypothetical protein
MYEGRAGQLQLRNREQLSAGAALSRCRFGCARAWQTIHPWSCPDMCRTEKTT